MKTAISLPDELFQRAEALAARLGISRSGLYAQALAHYLDDHATDGVTEALNEIYAETPSSIDPALEEAQARAVTEEW